MRVYNGVLEINSNDSVGYSDSMQILRTGSKVSVDGERYKIIGFKRAELAFGGNRIYFDVKKV